MQRRDLFLVIFTIGGLAVGVLFPGPASLFSGLTVYLVMAILFFSFLRLDFRALLRPGKAALLEVGLWGVVKLALVPLVMWGLFRWLWPAWATPVLLLSAMSAGVTGPFYAALLGADMVRVLMVVVATSLVLPFSLPLLIKLLTGTETGVGFLPMFSLLAQVIFIPAVLVLALKRWWPRAIEAIQRVAFPTSLALLFFINMAVFAPFAAHLERDPRLFVAATILAGVMFCVYLGLAILVAWLGGPRLDALTGQVALVYINNILGLVFAGRFLGVDSVLLCGCYLIPYYLAVIPLRWINTHTRFGPRQVD